jgi:type II secretory pathway component PulF
LLGIIVVGAIAIRFYYRTDNGRHVIDRLLLRTPVLGVLIQKSAIASFSQTFGLLLKSGVNIVESIDITKGTAGNVIVEDILVEAKEAVQRGEQISVTLTKYPIVFPPLVSSMIAIGEETGAVDSMLEKIARSTSARSTRRRQPDGGARADADRVPRCDRRLHRGGHVPADVRDHRAAQLSDREVRAL